MSGLWISDILQLNMAGWWPGPFAWCPSLGLLFIVLLSHDSLLRILGPSQVRQWNNAACTEATFEACLRPAQGFASAA